MLYIENNTAKKSFRMVYFILCISGIVLQYANAAIQDMNALPGNDTSCLMLNAYYTMITNIICCVYLGYLLVADPKHENPMVKGGIVMGIVLTGLGYHLLLSAAGGSMEGANTPFFAYSNLMVHTFTPLLAVVDYFLFSPKGEYKWYYPFAWLVLPTLYVIFIFIRAAISSNMFFGFNGKSRFPYPFLDVDYMGGGKVTLMIFIMLVVYIALGFASFGVDRLCVYIEKKIDEKKGHGDGGTPADEVSLDAPVEEITIEEVEITVED